MVKLGQVNKARVHDHCDILFIDCIITKWNTK